LDLKRGLAAVLLRRYRVDREEREADASVLLLVDANGPGKDRLARHLELQEAGRAEKGQALDVRGRPTRVRRVRDRDRRIVALLLDAVDDRVEEPQLADVGRHARRAD